MLRLRIDSCARRMPWAHGMERVELIAEFAQLGEPAYPVLLELCQDPRQDVAGDALAALGASGDVRLISVLHELPWPSEEDIYRRMERARTLMRLGDHSMAPHLIGGLEHKELFVRASCLQSLEEASGQRFGFVPSGTEAARAESVQRWRAWWTERSAPV
jgi:HEAT repeat protein